MKATLYIATCNKNDVLSNTLFSIARQKVSFPFEVCIVDDHSDVDPEPIVRKFIPDAKYMRLDKRYGSDTSNTYMQEMASKDTDIFIRQSADVIHARPDTIEMLCKGVKKKQVCMAAVSNTNPPHDIHSYFGKYLPKLYKQAAKGRKRSRVGKTQTSFYFFLGAILKSDYNSLKCTSGPHCDVMLGDELIAKGFVANYPKNTIGFHQQHEQNLAPCSRIDTCELFCFTRKRCLERGWHNMDDYLRAKRR